MQKTETPMLSIRFFRDQDDEVSGFDMGYLELDGNAGRISNQEKRCMIFIALSDLLNGVRGLLKGQRPTFNFIAADSSFRIDFVAIPSGGVRILSGNGAVLHSGSAAEVVRAVGQAAETFLGAWQHKAEAGRAAIDDLREALADWHAAFGRPA